jgi:hypothetical protein
MGCAGDAGPLEVADRFWSASQAADIARAREYVVESETTQLRDGADPNIRSYTLDEPEIDGERAWVATRVTAESGTGIIDVEFYTVLVHTDGGWKVDLSETAAEMVEAMVGAADEG